MSPYPNPTISQVIAESLSEEEIAGLKEMFKMIDTDNSGQITFEELKDGLRRFGANLNETEIKDLMQAVSSIKQLNFSILNLFILLFDVMRYLLQNKTISYKTILISKCRLISTTMVASTMGSS